MHATNCSSKNNNKNKQKRSTPHNSPHPPSPQSSHHRGAGKWRTSIKPTPKTPAPTHTTRKHKATPGDTPPSGGRGCGPPAHPQPHVTTTTPPCRGEGCGRPSLNEGRRETTTNTPHPTSKLPSHPRRPRRAAHGGGTPTWSRWVRRASSS